MIEANIFTALARQAGFDFYTGVPCSLLTGLINDIIADDAVEYVGATSEGEACGIAAGAWLAGRNPVVMLQNSGLGNTINPLTSLNHSFRIPMLMLVTWRGEPGDHDEPQHEIMGRSMHGLLDAIAIPHAPFPHSVDELPAALSQAKASMDKTGLPFVFVVRKGQIGSACPAPATRPRAVDFAPVLQCGDGETPTRYAVLSALTAHMPADAAVIATTGKTGRELFTACDRDQHLYVVGSMGCASAMGLGAALSTARPVVVLDGDGAALMKLGNLATVGQVKPINFIHILLDNGVHDSTGAQATASPGVNFAMVASACGYASAAIATDCAAVTAALQQALKTPGPHFIQALIRPGSIEKLGRPTIGPVAVARRMRRFITGEELPLPAEEPHLVAAE